MRLFACSRVSGFGTVCLLKQYQDETEVDAADDNNQCNGSEEDKEINDDDVIYDEPADSASADPSADYDYPDDPLYDTPNDVSDYDAEVTRSIFVTSPGTCLMAAQGCHTAHISLIKFIVAVAHSDVFDTF